jgi:uncharacterized protein YkwD
MVKYLFVFPFIFAFFIKAIAQLPSDSIISKELNKPYLEHLIKTKIDSVRNKHKIEILKSDSILYLASQHHAKYMMENNTLTHAEKNSKMKNPLLRAEHFGAQNYLVGENVAFTYMHIPMKDKKGKKYSNETYEELANDFINMWINSQGHFANMIKPDYSLTAIAIAIDEKTNKIYAVQFFGSKR